MGFSKLDSKKCQKNDLIRGKHQPVPAREPANVSPILIVLVCVCWSVCGLCKHVCVCVCGLKSMENWACTCNWDLLSHNFFNANLSLANDFFYPSQLRVYLLQFYDYNAQLTQTIMQTITNNNSQYNADFFSFYMRVYGPCHTPSAM